MPDLTLSFQLLDLPDLQEAQGLQDHLDLPEAQDNPDNQEREVMYISQILQITKYQPKACHTLYIFL